MNDEIKEILDYFRKYATIRENTMISEIEDYITNLEQANERLKETNVYCNRTDCSGRIGNSKKVEDLQQENQKYKEVIDKATNELFILKDMIYKPETREENFEIQRKTSSIIKRLNGKEV